MSRAWLTIVLAAAGTIVFKSLGPVLLGGRSLPPRVAAPLALLAPAVLAALVVTQAFGDGQRLVLDARAAGLGVALVAILLRAPVLLVVLLAAGTAAGVRALG